VTHFTDLEIRKLHLSTFEYISTSYYNLYASSIKKYTINEKVFEKHRKIKEDIIRNLAVHRHFVSYLVFFSSIRVDPGPTNRGPTSLLALKIRTPVANTGKLRSIGQMPVLYIASFWFIRSIQRGKV
jgi:hypothetical protein